MKYPLILSAEDGAEVFQNQDELIRSVEPIDVDNGEYVVYDSEGRLLSLYTKKPTGPLGFLQNVEIVLEDSEVVNPDQLRSLLIRNLEQLGLGQATDRDLNLEQLVQRLGTAGQSN